MANPYIEKDMSKPEEQVPVVTPSPVQPNTQQMQTNQNIQPNYQQPQQNYPQNYQQPQPNYPQNYQQPRPNYPQNYQQPQVPMKYCKYCAAQIPMDAVLCTSCGRQVEAISQPNATPQVVIHNDNNNVVRNDVNVNVGRGKPISKWTAFFLCLFLGFFGVHKFYEGKTGTGLLYLCTGGLCLCGWILDCILILLKPDPYYV